MTQTNPQMPSFNLWTEAWISVERPGGGLEALNLWQTLSEAHLIRALYEPSPLVVVAIHRLLVAILQAALRPQQPSDLAQIWRGGQFSTEKLQAFAAAYAQRFDLFSAEAPFLQSADLGLQPAKGDNVKPVGYLLSEQPAGTAVTHYNHTYDNRQQFCSRCAAKGLLTIPAFASSGGAGIKPSINGVPPIYVVPGGATLFHSLAASLTLPAYQPPNFQPQYAEYDTPWWEHEPIVPKKGIVRRVGYLHSLTFPARRVRLHPRPGQAPCTRCGQMTPWHTATMIYEMGESRPDDAAWWRDPFAAYRPPKEGEQPTPIRPVEGRAIWREFVALFLPVNRDHRPVILNQLTDSDRIRNVLPYSRDAPIPLRIIGVRTDMKMKTFEWQESGFDVPPRLLTDPDSAKYVEKSLEFARQCDNISKSVFDKWFEKRFQSVKTAMSQQYWQQLGQTFHHHIQQYSAQADAEALLRAWLQQTIRQAIAAFQAAVETLPDDGHTLRQRIEAVNRCRAGLYGYLNKTYPQEETP
ncbi:MAG: type I-E CRISPR-associated protein Cse1/CasA [Anaerolineae bacterium]|nr:type I-E CRISPR-associated protein Cse1/CasA [Anaerolineales bacterium]MCQ3974994.1 type I-E CRISPR-associated protein Cse1/CasA [Anaerolineae bacterium]